MVWHSFERAFYESPDYWDARPYTGLEAERVRLALEWLPADSGAVLDLGCGNGILTNRLAGRQVVGVDRSFAALHAVQAPRCQADASALPFAAGCFDAVVSMEMIEHLPVPTYGPALAEMVRVARRYLLITVPYCEDRTAAQVTCPACGCCFHPYQHMRSYGRPELGRLFEACGSVRLVRAMGIVPQQVMRFSTLRRTLARGLRRRRGLPWFAVCPQCGYTRREAGPPQGSSFAAKGMRSWLRRFWPKKQTYVWWMALYEKTVGQGG